MTRILLICHGHPELSIGGGEVAAARHAAALRAAGHEVLLMARAPTPPAHGGTVFATRPAPPGGAPADVLFHSPDYDHFLHSQRAKWAIYQDFRALLERFRPDAVHLHHFVHLGLELLREARAYAPRMPIVLTLHEFLAICHQHGQMLKTDGTLCARALPADCHACFPAIAPAAFFLRERFIKSFLRLADHLVCPSEFLRRRYLDWGLESAKLRVIANAPPESAPLPDAAPPEVLCRRFAFFGQITAFKGIGVFLDAAERLRATVPEARCLVHGTDRHGEPAVRAAFRERIAALGAQVSYEGPYRQDELAGLMRGIGWVVVPSLWWENAPLVIQEAFHHGRPVICADIGGMAEAVTDGRDGLHFRAGSAAALAATMAEACDPALWSRLRDGIAPTQARAAWLDAHLALYRHPPP